MTIKQILIIIGFNLLVVIIELLPFLPGPFFLFSLEYLSILTAFINIFIFVSGLFLIPFGLFFTIKQAKMNIFKTKYILLWTVPFIVIILTLFDSFLLGDFSRNFAINNAKPIIEAIEKYKSATSNYPDKLEELKPDYIKNIPSTGILGIEKYDYTKNGNDFNLTFIFNNEIVFYDPSGKERELGPQQTLYNTDYDEWKYFNYE